MARMNREDMDKAVNEHFGFEAADDLDGVMASLAGEVEHEIVPSPVGAQHDKTKIKAYYAALFQSVKGESVTPLKRYYGDDFVIDETLWNGEVFDGSPFLCDGKKGKKQMVAGLLTDEQGEPLSIQLYPGNTSDPPTFLDAVDKLKVHKG